MKFLFDNDYKKQIRAEIKSIISTNDTANVSESEEAAQILMSGYLGKFDLSKIFIRMYQWDAEESYTNGSQLYFTADAYSNTTAYTEDDLVTSGGYIYLALDDSTGVAVSDGTKWQKLCKDMSKFYAIDNIPAGTLPTDETKFTAGDLRHPVIIQKMIDITIYDMHSTTSGHQISENRVKRFESAIKWLEEIRDGVLDDPFLIRKTNESGDTTGTYIKFGSRVCKQNFEY